MIFYGLRKRLETLFDLGDGWDGSDSRGPSIRVKMSCAQFVYHMERYDIIQPRAMIDNTGTISFVWKSNESYVEIMHDNEGISYLIDNSHGACGKDDLSLEELTRDWRLLDEIESITKTSRRKDESKGT